jgi:MATE family multidrug resistance protein
MNTSAGLTDEDRNPLAQTRILLHLAIPVILSQISHTMVGLADTLMIGRTGDVDSLAASGLSNNIFSIPIVFCVGLTYILTPKVSEFFARNNRKECLKLLWNACLTNLAWAMVMVGGLLLLLPYAQLLKQPEQVLNLALPFLKLQIWSLPGLFLYQTFRQFLDGLGQTKPGMFVSIAGNLFNVLFNYFLIFGHGGFPELGLLGAGISNCISRWLMGLGMMAWFLFMPGLKSWRKEWKWEMPDLSAIWLLNKLGLPVGFQYLFEVGAFTFTSIMVGQMGAAGLASHQIVISVASLTYMMASGISSAASIRVGHFVGLQDREMIQITGRYAFQIASAFMALMAIIFLLGRYQLPLLFIENEQVLKVGAELFVIAGFFQLSDGIQVVGLGCLRGLSDVLVPTLITLVAYWVIAIPLGYYMGIVLEMGPAGTWWALLAGLSVSAFFMLFRFLSLSRSLTFSS